MHCLPGTGPARRFHAAVTRSGRRSPLLLAVGTLLVAAASSDAGQ